MTRKNDDKYSYCPTYINVACDSYFEQRVIIFYAQSHTECVFF